MPETRAPQTLPMGRLDALDVGSRKLTIQTEFLTRPEWHIETKIYIGGALKKTYVEDLSSTAESELQGIIDQFHVARRQELVERLMNLEK
ncbi:MAG TPA: hypothetical protein VMT00_11115 [Thermoanaerobaculia bacterium]|nr:hypothetical protein [Thermoanaerobaculia bacterium]